MDEQLGLVAEGVFWEKSARLPRILPLDMHVLELVLAHSWVVLNNKLTYIRDNDDRKHQKVNVK